MKNVNMIGSYDEYVHLSNSIVPDGETINLMDRWKDSLGSILTNTRLQHNAIRDISLQLYNTNGMYTTVINYLSGLYTFDHYIYPNFKSDVTDTETIRKNYLDSAKLLDKMDIKETFQQILHNVLLEGTAFYYEVESANKKNLRKLPYRYCKVTYSEGGVCRYAVNLNLISSEDVERFPQEIQKAWRRYRNKSFSNPWYQVSNLGVAFTTDENSEYGLPYFTFLIDSLNRYEKAKEKSDQKDDLDILKIIHQKIPTDSKTHKPAMQPQMVSKFHQATKDNLPGNIMITTNPLDMQAISLDNTNKVDNDILERATLELWNNSGLSNQLFNNTNNSAEALRKNIVVNQIIMKRFFNSFNLYINTKLINKGFSLVFLGITEMNKKEALETHIKALGFGGSRLLVLASQGLTPLQSINMLQLEQNALDIDSIMIPKETSYNSATEEGRPTNEEIGEPDSESREDSKNRGDF